MVIYKCLMEKNGCQILSKTVFGQVVTMKRRKQIISFIDGNKHNVKTFNNLSFSTFIYLL